MYIIFMNGVWIFDWVPYLPLTPVKLFLGLWIVCPGYQGEVIAYQIMLSTF